MDDFGLVKAATIKLRSGLYLSLVEPRVEDFTLEDIATGLSNICRFGGQTKYFYSVAQHAVMCALQAIKDELETKVIKACLHHDDTEAVLGDVVKPLKNLLRYYVVLEEGMERCIEQKFDVDFVSTEKDWKKIDREMLFAERNFLFDKDKEKWTGEDRVRKIEIPHEAWTPDRAFREYMDLATSF